MFMSTEDDDSSTVSYYLRSRFIVIIKVCFLDRYCTCKVRQIQHYFILLSIAFPTFYFQPKFRRWETKCLYKVTFHLLRLFCVHDENCQLKIT